MAVYKGKPTKVTAWSHSAFAVYDLCPFKYKCQNLDKLKKPDSPALRRGRTIHDDIAHYITDDPKFQGWRETIEHHHDLIEQIKAFPADCRAVEQKWGFTRRWRPTGYFANDIHLRVVLDVGLRYEDNTAEVVDWKTGKRYGSNDEQMEIFAATTFNKFHDAPTVTTRLAYVDSGDQEIVDWSREELELLQAKWDDKVRPMFEDTEFLPRPNDKCKWCDFSRSNGGPCNYG